MSYVLYVMCKMHASPPLNQSSTNTLQCMQYTDIALRTCIQGMNYEHPSPYQLQPVVFLYHPVFYSALEHQHLLNRSVAHNQISFFYSGMVVTKLDDTDCS